jgi:nucleotide-binding universal stress UspA family protein
MLKILIAVDGSELSLDAVHHSLALVQAGLQASFVLANVQESATLYEMVVAHDPLVLQEVSREAGTHLLSAAESLIRAAGVDFESVVESGDPANMLLDIVEREACDAVILGAKGHGNLRGALMGSVSQHMVTACPVPVTVVKHAEQDTEQDAEA